MEPLCVLTVCLSRKVACQLRCTLACSWLPSAHSCCISFYWRRRCLGGRERGAERWSFGCNLLPSSFVLHKLFIFQFSLTGYIRCSSYIQKPYPLAFRCDLHCFPLPGDGVGPFSCFIIGNYSPQCGRHSLGKSMYLK